MEYDNEIKTLTLNHRNTSQLSTGANKNFQITEDNSAQKMCN